MMELVKYKFKADKMKHFFTQQAVNFWRLLPQDTVERNNSSKWKKGLNKLMDGRSIEYLAEVSPRDP